MLSTKVPMVAFVILLVFGIIVSLLRAIVLIGGRIAVLLIVSFAVFVVLIVFSPEIIVFIGFLVSIVGVVEVSSTDIVIGQL